MEFFVFDTITDDGLPAKTYMSCANVASIDIVPLPGGTYRCHVRTFSPETYSSFTVTKPEPDILQTSGE